MLYTDLGEITLARFIDIFTGDIWKAVKEGEHKEAEVQEAAEKLCSEYLMIVGGRSVLAQVRKRDEYLKLQMRAVCLDICERLMVLGGVKEAADVMETLGYHLSEVKDVSLKRKITSVRQSDRYRMSKLAASFTKSDGTKIDKEHFVKERVMVMSHWKMHIDANVFSAKEYAYMVKFVCDEMEAAARQMRKKTKKKR